MLIILVEVKRGNFVLIWKFDDMIQRENLILKFLQLEIILGMKEFRGDFDLGFLNHLNGLYA